MIQERIDSPPTKIRLAERVAATVDIIEVRLVETSAMQQMMDAAHPPKVRVARKSETIRNNEDGFIAVKISFLFEAKDAEKEGGAKVKIEAVYDLMYRLENLSQFSDEEIDAFGDVNGCYNAWPFWREYVYTTLARMGLPPITLPVFRYDESTKDTPK